MTACIQYWPSLTVSYAGRVSASSGTLLTIAINDLINATGKTISVLVLFLKS